MIIKTKRIQNYAVAFREQRYKIQNTYKYGLTVGDQPAVGQENDEK